jgi:hypothetical protein
MVLSSDGVNLAAASSGTTESTATPIRAPLSVAAQVIVSQAVRAITCVCDSPPGMEAVTESQREIA